MTFPVRAAQQADAYNQPIGPERTPQGDDEVEVAGARQVPAASRRVCAGHDTYTQETEFGIAQGC